MIQCNQYLFESYFYIKVWVFNKIKICCIDNGIMSCIVSCKCYVSEYFFYIIDKGIFNGRVCIGRQKLQVLSEYCSINNGVEFIFFVIILREKKINQLYVLNI